MGAADGRMMLAEKPATAQRLREALACLNAAGDPAACLGELIRQGLDQLPLPGSGHTLARWRALAAVGEHDLSLAKLYEGHTDALAILSEITSSAGAHHAANEKAQSVPQGENVVWGVWASEAPGGRVTIQPAPQTADGAVRLQGIKHWCSGAKTGSHALLTVWHPDGQEPQLARLALAQPGVQVSEDRWKAVGMQASASLQVQLDGATAYLVGEPGQYLSRPGFWQGGAGVAACWYGGATTLAKTLFRAVAQIPEASRSPFRLAAAGRVAVKMRGMALMLQDAARWIDEHPRSDASVVARRVRLAAAQCATDVLEEVAAALGATPFCTDAAFARAAADLPVFIRQSHGDRDYAALGQQLVSQGEDPWAL
jgi:hypothetical protein